MVCFVRFNRDGTVHRWPHPIVPRRSALVPACPKLTPQLTHGRRATVGHSPTSLPCLHPARPCLADTLPRVCASEQLLVDGRRRRPCRLLGPQHHTPTRGLESPQRSHPRPCSMGTRNHHNVSSRQPSAQASHSLPSHPQIALVKARLYLPSTPTHDHCPHQHRPVNLTIASSTATAETTL